MTLGNNYLRAGFGVNFKPIGQIQTVIFRKYLAIDIELPTYEPIIDILDQTLQCNPPTKRKRSRQSFQNERFDLTNVNANNPYFKEGQDSKSFDFDPNSSVTEFCKLFDSKLKDLIQDVKLNEEQLMLKIGDLRKVLIDNTNSVNSGTKSF